MRASFSEALSREFSWTAAVSNRRSSVVEADSSSGDDGIVIPRAAAVSDTICPDRRAVAGGLDIVTAGVGVICLDSPDSVAGDAARFGGWVEGGGVIEDDGGVGE